jgi:hypothetical protein
MDAIPMLISHSAVSRTEMLFDSLALVNLIVPLDRCLRTIRASYCPILAEAAVDDEKTLLDIPLESNT